jgi:1-acyl-sn-glycerol-3-phosphate acyltransferase
LNNAQGRPGLLIAFCQEANLHALAKKIKNCQIQEETNSLKYPILAAMALLSKIFRFLFSIYGVVLFIALLLIVFPLALVASLFGKIKGGNIIYRICMIWADIWFPLIGIFHTNTYEQKLNPKQSYVFVANHISYLDAALIPKVVRRPVRPLGKIEISKIPLFGFVYKSTIVTVDRSSPQNRAQSVRVLKSILNKGVSIFFFPEGTFNDTGKPLKDFYDGAFRIAIETGTPIKPVLFLDAYKRMHPSHLFSLTPGKSRAIFLEEVPVDGLSLKEVPQLKRKVYEQMEVKLRQYGASWINT